MASRQGNSRTWFAVGAVAAASVTLVFATVGDGVDTGEANGVRRLLLDHGHTLTWLLLTLALVAAALRDGWGPASKVLAVVAAACYGLFLAAVLL